MSLWSSHVSRALWALAGLAGLAGCSFDAAPTDGGPVGERCTPQTVACDGRVRRTCGADGRWNASADEICGFTCAAAACVAASNVPPADVASCDGSAPVVALTAGTVATLEGPGRLRCAPHCGEPGVTQIDARGDLGAMSWFCVASLTIADGVTLRRPGTGGPGDAIIFVVDGAAQIAGEIDFRGGDATSSAGGEGAPGAGDGADRSGGPGARGEGNCPGNGGQRGGAMANAGAGGGGGASHATLGGLGGSGLNPGAGVLVGLPGLPGPLCGDPDLRPLAGGGGGGGGASGSCTGPCGFPGGGGGGALQISARRGIAVADGGLIDARGGDGYGATTGTDGRGGGGGGGAGGAVLLEAPVVELAGAINVDGGDGGASAGGAGGSGATGDNGARLGASYQNAGDGGAGGGGGGGRIRLIGVAATCAAGVSPTAACTASGFAP